MDKPHGGVIILMEPDTISEDEFNDWYDYEHIPQRIDVPGMLSVERFVCTDGWPRYLCLYDWDSLDILSGDEYKAIHHASKRTPWTKRILGRVRGWCAGKPHRSIQGGPSLEQRGRRPGSCWSA